MDAVTLALAKAYSDSKGGYAEPQKTILARTTLDFNKNAAYLPDPFNFVVGCEYKLTISLGGESESYTGVATEMTDNGITVVTVVFGGIIACADFPPNVAEIYGAAASLAYMASGNVTVDPATEFEIVKPETIHPIDPKYLPEGVVNINLDDYGIDINPALASGGGRFTVENVGTFWEDVTTAKMLTFVSTNLGGAYDMHTPGGYSLAYYNGTILHQVAMTITLLNGNNILDVHLCIVRYNTVGATVYCTVSATAAPT